MMSIYEMEVEKPDGRKETLDKYKGKPLIVVNTASKCGLTPQFEELQSLYDTYKDQGLEILGFPCAQFANQEFADLEETMEFCQKNYGVDFPMHAKVDVNGENAHPLFAYLTSGEDSLPAEGIEWNFAKFLIDPEGKPVKRYPAKASPKEIEADLKKLL